MAVRAVQRHTGQRTDGTTLSCYYPSLENGSDDGKAYCILGHNIIYKAALLRGKQGAEASISSIPLRGDRYHADKVVLEMPF